MGIEPIYLPENINESSQEIYEYLLQAYKEIKSKYELSNIKKVKNKRKLKKYYKHKLKKMLRKKMKQ